jgi:hypothetical protein
MVPCRYRALMIMAISPLFAHSFLPTPPHDDAVAAQLTFPPAGYVEDFHLQESAPCRAHHKKTPLVRGF